VRIILLGLLCSLRLQAAASAVLPLSAIAGETTLFGIEIGSSTPTLPSEMTGSVAKIRFDNKSGGMLQLLRSDVAKDLRSQQKWAEVVSTHFFKPGTSQISLGLDSISKKIRSGQLMIEVTEY